MSSSQNNEYRLSEFRTDSQTFSGQLPSLKESLGLTDDQPLLPRPGPTTAPSVPRLINPTTARLYVDNILCLTYQICGKSFTMQVPQNEGVAAFTRQTMSGKNLSYRLKVVQQPEKARACGSGPRCKLL